MREKIFNWKTSERKSVKRTVDWFWTVGSIGLGIAILSIILNNLLFGVFVIISTIALLLISIKKPDTADFGLDERGAHINKKLYPYSTLESFWLDEERKILLIKSGKTFMPLLSLPLTEELEIEGIRELLSAFLDEEELREPLGERIMEYLGF